MLYRWYVDWNSHCQSVHGKATWMSIWISECWLLLCMDCIGKCACMHPEEILCMHRATMYCTTGSWFLLKWQVLWLVLRSTQLSLKGFDYGVVTVPENLQTVSCSVRSLDMKLNMQAPWEHPKKYHDAVNIMYKTWLTMLIILQVWENPGQCNSYKCQENFCSSESNTWCAAFSSFKAWYTVYLLCQCTTLMDRKKCVLCSPWQPKCVGCTWPWCFLSSQEWLLPNLWQNGDAG